MVPNADSYCEIDPDIVDRWGIPVLRFHWKWSDHEYLQAKHMQETCRSLITAMGGEPFTAMPTREEGYFSSIMAAIAGVIEEGQVRGDIRTGDSGSLSHLLSVLLNEYALLDVVPGVEKLSKAQFHDFVDGALRVAPALSAPDK